MKVLITGGNGMVGAHFSPSSPSFTFLKPSKFELDVCNLESISNYIEKEKDIDAIIHLVFLGIKETEENLSHSSMVNICGTVNMLSFARQKNIPFIFVSSGAVFAQFSSLAQKIDGYDFRDTPCPNTEYGKMKYICENICRNYEKSIILRTGWLFGEKEREAKRKFLDRVIFSLISYEKISVNDQFSGSFTYVKDFVEAVLLLLKAKSYGVHHLVNSGKATAYDASLIIADYFGVDSSLLERDSTVGRSEGEFLKSSYEMRDYREALLEYLSSAFPKEKWKRREKCRLCTFPLSNAFLVLKSTPLANDYSKLPEKKDCIPLTLVSCPSCLHIQLGVILNPQIIFENYLYLTKTSQKMVTHVRDNIDKFCKIAAIEKDSRILEIGANDGTGIIHLINNGYLKAMGIDPARNIRKLHKLPIICDFFSSDCRDKLHDSYDLIYSFHTFAHIENIHDCFNFIDTLLSKKGVFVIEVGYLLDIYQNKTFDVIYHEHLDYHTVRSLSSFAKKFDLEIFLVDRNDIQGGSLLCFFGRKGEREVDVSVSKLIEAEQILTIDNFQQWKKEISLITEDAKMILSSLKQRGKRIVGYGCAAKVTTFMYQLGLTENDIEYIIDDNPLKQNMYTPGLNIPIYGLSFLDSNIDYIVIFSWNFADEIIDKLRASLASSSSLSAFRKEKKILGLIIPFPVIKIVYIS